MLISEDQKIHWNLLETVRWICTRDAGRVAAMWEMDEYHGIAVALFGVKPEFDPRCLLFFKEINPDAGRDVAGLRSESKSSGPDAFIVMEPSDALRQLL